MLQLPPLARIWPPTLGVRRLPAMQRIAAGNRLFQLVQPMTHPSPIQYLWSQPSLADLVLQFPPQQLQLHHQMVTRLHFLLRMFGESLLLALLHYVISGQGWEDQQRNRRMKSLLIWRTSKEDRSESYLHLIYWHHMWVRSEMHHLDSIHSLESCHKWLGSLARCSQLIVQLQESMPSSRMDHLGFI